ncbi:MAG: PAS domain S-box protein [Nitrospirae bacterium]|nr:PAS domain S-box protein [Nitrospirota bacterium]
MRRTDRKQMEDQRKDTNDSERLLKENLELGKRYDNSIKYIRTKVNQLLTVMGTSPLRPEELDDATLLEIDPIGIISESFVQILRHLHQTNEKLKITNEEIQAIFDSAGTGILVIDKDLRILAYNRSIKEQFFPDKPEMLGEPCFTSICNFEDPHVSCPFIKVFETGRRFHQMHWVLAERHYDVMATPVRDDQGEISRVVLVYMDITDRIRADEALRKSEERYRDLFENANDLIQSVGPDGSILYVNQAWHEALGYSRDEVPDLSIFDIIHPDCDGCSDEFKSVVYGEKAGRLETTFITKGGDKINVEGNINSIIEQGRFCGTRGIFRDITERKKAEMLIASEREQLAVTLRSIGDGVITTDTNARVVLMNRVAEHLTGWRQSEAEGIPITEIFRIINEKTRGCCENPVEGTLKRGKVAEISAPAILIAKDGSEMLISNSVAPIMDKNSVVIGTVLVFRDITGTRKMEEKILKAEKIESLGVLAGGIAHDFNNLLNAILGNVDLALLSSRQGDEIHESLIRAEKATLRARDLTRQLLTFSKGGAPIKKASSITEIIKDSADFASRGSNVKCEFLFPGDLWKVEIDEGQISQVINNLVLNAVQAMPGGGTIRIGAENTALGESEIPQLNQGNYVKITIRDTGAGIPKEDLSRIFEPYFTTKHTGSGLGLATAYSILRSHNGIIDVESSTGAGATFYLYLPALLGAPETAVKAAPPSTNSNGNAKILLMDDDGLIRVTASDMLKRLGYQVELAADGEEAIRLYREAKDTDEPFDAVIMDLTVPGGMGGAEAVKKLIEIDPEVKAIVSSGYSSDAIMANYKQYGFAGVLAKPYKRKDLGEALQNIIAKQGS